MIKERIETERLLRLYGNAQTQSHVRYVDSFVPREVRMPHERLRITFRRAVLVMLIAAMLFASVVVVCDAFGIHLFWFQKDQKKGHAFLKDQRHEDGSTYYVPSYTVDGYHRIDNILDENDILVMAWKRSSDDLCYSITETTSRETTIDINTENLREEKEIIGDEEVLLYYEDAGTVSTAYFQRNRTFIGIAGPLPKEEMVKVIESMVAIDK